MTINGDLVSIYTHFVTSAVNAWLPLMTVVISIFLTFAIANLMRFFIIKSAK